MAFDHTVYLNSKRYKVVGPPQEQLQTQLPQKEVIGREPTAADHFLTSTLALGDASGGYGRRRFEPGGDTDKVLYSTLDTRWAGKVFTLPTLATSDVPSTYGTFSEGGWAMCLRNSNGLLYPLMYSGIQYWVTSVNMTASGFAAGWSAPLVDPAAGSPGNMQGGTGTYITDSVRFGDNQYFAVADGSRVPTFYEYANSIVAVSTPTTVLTYRPMKFAVLGNNLYAIAQKSGDTKTLYLVSSTTPNVAVSPVWAEILTLPRDDRENSVRFFVQGWDDQGQPCFYLGTGRAVWRLSSLRGVSERIFTFPRLYDSSDADTEINACVWEKNQNLYVSQGFNLWEIDGSGYQDISPFTLNDGLPGATYATSTYGLLNMQNSIIDIFPRRDELCMVSRGAAGPNNDGYVLVYRNQTWHRLTVSTAGQAGTSTTLAARAYGKGISYGNGVMFRCEAWARGLCQGLKGVWDLDGSVPLDARRTADLASSYQTGGIVFPFWNGNFPVDPKLLLSAVFYGGQADVSAFYYLDQSSSFNSFGSGTTTLIARGSSVDLSVASGVGVSFKDSRLGITVSPATGGTDSYGMIESVGFKYQILPKPLWGWRVEVDLSASDDLARPPTVQRDEIKALAGIGPLVPFYYGSEGTAAAPKLVELTGLHVFGFTDDNDPGGTAVFTLVEPRPNSGFV